MLLAELEFIFELIDAVNELPLKRWQKQAIIDLYLGEA